jgi:hypothetical protein
MVHEHTPGYADVFAYNAMLSNHGFSDISTLSYAGRRPDDTISGNLRLSVYVFGC